MQNSPVLFKMVDNKTAESLIIHGIEKNAEKTGLSWFTALVAMATANAGNAAASAALASI
jgi:hypothetical protein